MKNFRKQSDQSSYATRRQAVRDAKLYADAAISAAVNELELRQVVVEDPAPGDGEVISPPDPEDPLSPIQQVSISLTFKNADDTYDYDELKKYGVIVISPSDGSNMTLVTTKVSVNYDLNNIQIQVAPID